eukprot:CAMPEP_0179109612 /NCGR_PEP_ID=MMETSP0796-20121207/51118_1 /TAXON_ID=73915 /ORGANISM="Pyrodinium bahamense, Strain pbaha01" /LENGTH=117 /DNA_ID=CAMNT_0020807725 /DNA_START=502 /DNA_END=856 /DNA_ORIENTATION=+
MACCLERRRPGYCACPPGLADRSWTLLQLAPVAAREVERHGPLAGPLLHGRLAHHVPCLLVLLAVPVHGLVHRVLWLRELCVSTAESSSMPSAFATSESMGASALRWGYAWRWSLAW